MIVYLLSTLTVYYEENQKRKNNKNESRNRTHHSSRTLRAARAYSAASAEIDRRHTQADKCQPCRVEAGEVDDTVLFNTRAIPQTEQFVRNLLELVEDDHLEMGDDPIVADCSACGAIMEVTEALGNCCLLLSRKEGHSGQPDLEPNPSTKSSPS